MSLSVSEIVESYDDMREIDLNPVVVYERGLDVADAGALIKKDGGLTNW